MKKILILLVIPILLLTGCVKEKEIKKVEEKKQEPIKEEIKEPTYTDENNTPIGIYTVKGNTLYKLTSDSYKVKPFDDIGVFQVFPSNEDKIVLNDSFANSFYNNWINYKQDKNLKMGFNIKFTTSNENISYNIFHPSNAMDKWEYLLNYLYDDYANRYKSFYSHIENDEFNENTLFTSIKLQSCDKIYEIVDKIELTVFTYDSEDDFLDNEYRGNSKYTYTINIIKE